MTFWYVYIMANKPNGVIYIDVTDNLDERVREHKYKIYPKSFTARYICENLVYFEEFDNGEDASTRERRFKKWKREWKVNLIEEMNPSWTDLSINWNLDNNREFRVNK
ncbi:GIY-YIG nuclease family protein [Psychroserpens mesophilus]|uniref:GIY-YIG nuclease family protein n=1 Tax=Psychroserpens mesophilus TaxID=325473 RepID=UPI003F493A9A